MKSSAITTVANDGETVRFTANSWAETTPPSDVADATLRAPDNMTTAAHAASRERREDRVGFMGVGRGIVSAMRHQPLMTIDEPRTRSAFVGLANTTFCVVALPRVTSVAAERATPVAPVNSTFMT